MPTTPKIHLVVINYLVTLNLCFPFIQQKIIDYLFQKSGTMLSIINTQLNKTTSMRRNG